MKCGVSGWWCGFWDFNGGFFLFLFWVSIWLESTKILGYQDI